MIPTPLAPNVLFAERFSKIIPPRLEDAPIFPSENNTPRYRVASRVAQEVTIHPFFAWSSTIPFLLWAGQEEPQSDSGGTLVFIACCAFVIGIFSKTGWRNESPR